MTGTARGYTFGPREPGGVLLGLRGGQWSFLLVAAAAVVVVVNRPGLWTFLGSVLVIGGCLLGAFYRVRGRTLDEYVRIAVNVAHQRATGNHVYRGGPLFRLALTEPADAFGDGRPPGLLAAMRFARLETSPGAADVLVAYDPTDRTYVVVLMCRGGTLHLLESGEQDRRVAAYGELLATLCQDNGLIAAVQVLERSLPETGDALRRDWQLHGTPEPARAGAGWAAAAYAQTLAAAGPRGQRRETYVALAVDARRAAREIADAGGGDQGAAAVAFREASRLADGLRRAGVEVLGLLPPRGLGYVVRTTYDPASTEVVDRRGGGAGDDAGGDPGLASGTELAASWPARAEAAWDLYRTDSAFHTCYWVLSWPQRVVPAAFLAPLLLQTTVQRTVSLLYQPLGDRRAGREIGTRQSRVEGEDGLRRRFRLRARRRAQSAAEELARREAELVSGHGLHRLQALITVTAGSLEQLEAARLEVESLAAQSQLEIRRLYGEHEQGLVLGALPLARRPR